MRQHPAAHGTCLRRRARTNSDPRGRQGGWSGSLLLSYGFGFMSRNTAEKLASTSSERAVIAEEVLYARGPSGV
jgi:hypothetical protein